MLTSLNRLMGMPVVWRDRQVGLVERAAADAARQRLCGLVVRRGIGSARWVPCEDILLLGESCVVLRARPVRLPEELPEAFGRVFLTTGESAGEVTDAVLHREQRRILALEVSPGPLYRLAGRCVYAPGYHVQPGRVIVSRLLDWTQLLSQLGEEETE